MTKLHPHADSSAAFTIPRAGISFLKAGESDIQAPVVQKGITPRADTTAALSICRAGIWFFNAGALGSFGCGGGGI